MYFPPESLPSNFAYQPTAVYSWTLPVPEEFKAHIPDEIILPLRKDAETEVFWVSDEIGWGLRSLNRLKKGAFICEYTGTVRADDEVEMQRTSAPEHRHHYYFDLATLEDVNAFKKAAAERRCKQESGKWRVKKKLNRSAPYKISEKTPSRSTEVTAGEEHPAELTPATFSGVDRNDTSQKGDAPRSINSDSESAHMAAADEQDRLHIPWFVVDAYDNGNQSRFVNHRCDGGNSKVQFFFCEEERLECGRFDARRPRLALMTTKEVEHNEEITYDYRTCESEGVSIPCACGAANCRQKLF